MINLKIGLQIFLSFASKVLISLFCNFALAPILMNIWTAGINSTNLNYQAERRSFSQNPKFARSASTQIISGKLSTRIIYVVIIPIIYQSGPLSMSDVSEKNIEINVSKPMVLIQIILTHCKGWYGL